MYSRKNYVRKDYVCTSSLFQKVSRVSNTPKTWGSLRACHVSGDDVFALGRVFIMCITATTRYNRPLRKTSEKNGTRRIDPKTTTSLTTTCRRRPWWSLLGVSHDVYPGQAFPVERLRVLFHQLFAVLEVVHAFPAITLAQTFPDQLRFLDVDHGLARLVLSLTHERHRVRARRRRVEV